MFFATVPPQFRRYNYGPSGRALERFMQEAQCAVGSASPSNSAEDETAYTLTLDVPGVTKEQLSIGIEGTVVRISSKEGAPRQYKKAFELPQEIDSAQSSAKLENGVLTLRLVKVVPVSKVTELAVH